MWAAIAVCVLALAGVLVMPANATDISSTSLSSTHLSTTTTNMSGYNASTSANSASNVSTIFREPTLTCTSSDASVSIWVGMNSLGYKTVSYVAAIGTTATCSGGVASYSAWYDLYGSSPVTITTSKTIKAGDKISILLSYYSGSYVVNFWDMKTPVSDTYHSTFAGISEGNSVEWIVSSTLPLAEFSNIRLTDCYGSLNSSAPVNLGSLPYELIHMKYKGQLLDKVSAVQFNTAFTLTWERYGP